MDAEAIQSLLSLLDSQQLHDTHENDYAHKKMIGCACRKEDNFFEVDGSGNSRAVMWICLDDMPGQLLVQVYAQSPVCTRACGPWHARRMVCSRICSYGLSSGVSNGVFPVCNFCGGTKINIFPSPALFLFS